jgi:hypothetical protein
MRRAGRRNYRARRKRRKTRNAPDGALNFAD